MLAAFFRCVVLASSTSLILVRVTCADEIAYGDVTAKGTSSIRFLEDYLDSQDAAGFFGGVPMAGHEWSHVRVVLKSLNATLLMAEAADMGQVTNNTVAILSKELEPLYRVMPKNSNGLLSDGTVMYLMHRFYTVSRGWSLKGLQPAGGSWKAEMAVTTDVKDITKHIIPSYLVTVLLELFGTDGLSLRSVAIVCATIEHLAYGETLEYLFHVYKALGLSTKGELNTLDAQRVLDAFVMVFAFGFMLDFASAADVQRSVLATKKDQSRWFQISALLGESFQKMPPVKLDFAGVSSMARQFVIAYPGWQSRSCSEAKKHLMSLDPNRTGLVDASRVESWEPVPSRPMFMQDFRMLRNIGALLGDHVLIPNYMVSNAMCVSTAGFAMSCCPNECEGLIGHLENHVGGPEGDAERILNLVANLPSSTVVAPRTLSVSLAQQLLEAGPRVDLHSKQFAYWLHDAYPWECPRPSSKYDTNPTVAADWMAAPPPNVATLEDMLGQISAATGHYTHVELDEKDISRTQVEPEEVRGVTKFYPPGHGGITKQAVAQPWAISVTLFDALRPVVLLASLWATFRMAIATCRSARVSFGGRCCVPEKADVNKV